jgi:hypothetical protein
MIVPQSGFGTLLHSTAQAAYRKHARAEMLAATVRESLVAALWDIQIWLNFACRVTALIRACA